MDFDGLVQVLIGIGFVVFWLVGAGQKKKPGPGSVPRSIDQTNPSTGKVDTERLIMEALGLAEVDPGFGSEAPPPAGEVGSEVVPYESEAQSLMVGSSPAEQELRHEAFHERYVVHRPVAGTRQKRVNRNSTPGGLSVREAIVWREILGPPKSMQ